MSEIQYTKAGQMKPTLPPKVHKALAHLRAMTVPYFDSKTVDEAEYALRVEIAALAEKAWMYDELRK